MRTVSPAMVKPPETVAVKLTAWPKVEGLGPLSVRLVVVADSTAWLTWLDWLVA